MIQLKKVSKSFHTAEQNIHAVKNVDLEIKAGEIFGIIGFSGAGKSTLVRCINLLERPTAGSVIVNGQDLTKLGKRELREVRRKIGMIFQHFNLMRARTVYQNVAFPLKKTGMGREEKEKKIKGLLELVGLQEKRNAYPSQLSGGQKQRVAIARALANDPDVLLCDEATSALDPQTTKSILRLFKKVNEDMKITIVLITHEMAVVKDICDRVAIMEGGAIVEEGSTVDVFSHPKEEVTRNFINTAGSFDKIYELMEADNEITRIKEAEQDGASYIYGRKCRGRPYLRLAREYDVEANIIYGNIDFLKNKPLGKLVVNLGGTAENVSRALEYIKNSDIEVEVMKEWSLLYRVAPNLESLSGELAECTVQTLQMLIIPGSIAFFLGIFFGVILILTRRDGILRNPVVYGILDKMIDVIRSIPFIILMVLLIPISRAIVGTGSGVTGSYVALIAGTVPFFARQIESVLSDVDRGLVEASEAMGFSPAEIVFSIYLKESIPGISRVTMITCVSLIGITAIAGAIGAGGLGDFAIRYGYQMGYRDMIWVTVILLLAIISIIQFTGNYIIRKSTH